MKRIVAFLTLLMILVSSMAFAEGVVVIGEKKNKADNHDRAERVSGPHTSGSWTYYLLDDGTAEISKHDSNHTPDTLTVPATLDGYQVSSIGFNGAWASSATIVIPDSITNVLENPCTSSYCKKIVVSPEHPTLATIDGVLFNKEYKRLLCYPYGKTDTTYTIPKGIREIANLAFNSDDELRTVTIPDTVTRIDGNPFYYCNSITKLNISATHPNLVMNGNALIDQDTGTLHTYLISSKATEFAVPSGVTAIANNAFASEKELATVFLPSGVTSIHDNAFHSCDKLSYISLPEGLTEIGTSAFAHCYRLTSIEFPSTLTTIGNGAFYNTPLDSVILPDGLTSIGNYAFNDGAKNVTIPASVEFIGENAFRKDVILTVDHDSYALEYARANNLEYTYPDSLDWLLD